MKDKKSIRIFLFLSVIIIAIAKPQLMKITSRGIPDSAVPMGLGVNIHFVEPQARDIDMIATAGFKFIRMDFDWDRIENKKGEYDFTGYEHLVDALAARGICPLFILDYGNHLYDSEMKRVGEKDRQAFARFATAAAARFKGRSIIWELWNEPNVPDFWKPKPDANEYMALAKVTLPAVRKADPDATIIAPATSTIDLKFLESCFKQGLLEMIDAVSVHPYREGPPETVVTEYRNLSALIARFLTNGREHMPIVSGEWGYPVTKATSKEQQGQYLARQFLINLMTGIPLSIWYDWHNDGQDPNNNEHNFGTVTWDYQEKPAYIAAKSLINELNGYRFTKRIPLPSDNDYVALFAKGREQKLALWTSRETHRVTVELERKMETELTRTPQYLTLQLNPAYLDREKIFYIKNNSLWCMKSDGTTNKQIFRSEYIGQINPDLDNQKVLFITKIAGNYNAGNWAVCATDNSGSSVLTVSQYLFQYGDYDISWLLNGEKIFIREKNMLFLYLANDLNSIEKIFSLSVPINRLSESEHLSYASLSPNEDNIIFVTWEGGGYALHHIYLMNAKSLAYHEIGKAYETAGSVKPIWSPCGSKILFNTMERTGGIEHGLYIQDIYTKRFLRLDEWGEDARWAPNGEKIVYAQILYPKLGRGLYIIDADGKNKRFLIANDDSTCDRLPQWNSQGNMIIFNRYYLFSEYRGEVGQHSPEIWTVDLEGKNIRRLTDKGCYLGFANWGD
jgi:polysaccharide biosynthesis protein PslG